ncbi:MAG: hypothetical protein IV101_04140 [Dechloromonas sp.]|uniref:hypothetical protein n=1 Tax=Ferribacterium limneticum TaxID=76259 RepID=UPI001CF83D08|nr:hypothetical protein [Ferribacterium limneticum]MBT9520063.1 hypothetical protein [Dechloromonas sp.]UCV24037.1 hypothetical protein KI613_05785 [Ferribacterium limneticum]
MKLEELLHHTLAIHAPWRIVRVRNDLGKSQIDIWVSREAQRSGWFFATRSSPTPGSEQIWRHINIGNARCIVHAVIPSDVEDADLQWLGEASQPFTRAFARQIAGMFMQGVSFASVCALLDLPVADLWKFKHRLDTGKSGLSAQGSAADANSAQVPAPNDPIWEELLSGSLQLDIRILSLKLLLTKLREQFSVIGDSEVRNLKAHELQRYFTRHEKMLSHELAQLARN